jgi:hypothetical protein
MAGESVMGTLVTYDWTSRVILLVSFAYRFLSGSLSDL